MKCPNCGYFNMPGATVCGSCRRALNEAPAATQANAPHVPIAEIYPPRASKRTKKQQIEAHSPVARKTNRYVEADWERTRQNARQRRLNWKSARNSFRESVRWWCNGENLRSVASRNVAPFLSCIPGLGQFIQRRYPMAVTHFVLFVALLSVVVNILIQDRNLTLAGQLAVMIPIFALLTMLLLNGIIFAFCALVWFSVWDAARHAYSQPSSQDSLGEKQRNLRILYGSLFYVAIILALFFWWLNVWRN